MGLELRNFDYKSELTKQRALFLECFPENAGSPVVTDEHYLWKFHGNNQVQGSYEYCAWIDDKLAGYYAAIVYPYNYFGKGIRVGMVCDVMTGINARGQGVFTKLGKFALEKLLNSEDIGFLTGYPIRKEVIPGHRKSGWDFPFVIPMYGKFLALNSFLRSRKLRWARFILNPFLILINLIINLFRRSCPSVVVEEYTSDNIDSIEGFELFLEDLQSQTPISLKKDKTFLKWRLGAPGKKYIILLMKVDSKPVGYAVGRYVVKENVPCFGVLDFSIIPGFENYSTELLKEVERIAKANGAELILIMILKRFAARYRFFKNGWLRTPYNFSFILQRTTLINDKKKLMNEDNWFLSWLDSDDL
jgi:hypothetical protein